MEGSATNGALSDPLLAMRPGANVFAHSPDRLQIAFPNHTATFVSARVVRTVRALVEALAAPVARAEAIERASAAAGVDPGVAEYVLDLLWSSRCLRRTRSGEVARPADPLAEFLSSLGDDGEATVARLREAQLAVVQGDAGEPIEGALAEAGLRVDPLRALPGDDVGAIVEHVRGVLDAGATTILCWGVPYRLPLAAQLNALALQARVPILFGVCEGVVGRIGPYVLPGASSCLECLNRRALSHAGPREAEAHAAWSGGTDAIVPEPWPVHPAFRGVVLRLLAIELADVVLGLPPRSIGGVTELTLAHGLPERHPVYQVPGCPACGERRPRRWAWDARLAPVARGSTSE